MSRFVWLFITIVGGSILWATFRWWAFVILGVAWLACLVAGALLDDWGRDA